MDYSSLRTPIVIDVGTGTTKLGFGGNLRPSSVFPTLVSTKHEHKSGDELPPFTVGPGPEQRTRIYDVAHPVKRGAISDWVAYEQLMFSCLCEKLQVDTKEHPVLLTEPPLNAASAQESVAEVMFETFQVPALHLATQAVLALYGVHAFGKLQRSGNLGTIRMDDIAAEASVATGDLTGTVIDAGEGVTHVVPIVNGYVVGAAIRSVDLAGCDVTAYIQSSLRARGQTLPPDFALDICRDIKHQHPQCVKSCKAELAKPEASIARTHAWQHPVTGEAGSVSVARERFLAPEIYYDPSIARLSCQSLPQLVDSAVQSCAIDSRRKLYSAICLSGGATMFNNFGRKLKMEVQALVNARLPEGSKGLPVNVFRHQAQDIAVWLGGSLLSVTPNFAAAYCHTRAEYEERGPSICWSNDVMHNVN